MRSKRIGSYISAVCIFALILDSRTAITGAVQGIHFCMYSVIPSLWPISLLSIYLISNLRLKPGNVLSKIAALCRIPTGGEAIFLLGMIGGYPVGAQCIRKSYDNGQLSTADAKRLLAFCNNPGPAFVFGILGNTFMQKWIPWLIWGILILSAIITGIFIPGKCDSMLKNGKLENMSFTQAMLQSIKSISIVCAWVILFRIVIEMINAWILWRIPIAIRTVICGILEIVNGCNALRKYPNDSYRFIVSSILLSFGGICVSMQTHSVTKGFGFKSYLYGKLIQTSLVAGISMIIAGIFIDLNMNLVIIGCAILIIITAKSIFRKITVDFPQKTMYNTKKWFVRNEYVISKKN